MKNLVLNFLQERKEQGCFVVLEAELFPLCPNSPSKIQSALEELLNEGSIFKQNGGWSLK